MMLFGLKVVYNEHCVSRTEDWSGCRSPSRAKRRHAMGIPQRMVVREQPAMYLIDPDVLYVNPRFRMELEKLTREGKQRVPFSCGFGPDDIPYMTEPDDLRQPFQWSSMSLMNPKSSHWSRGVVRFDV